MSHPDLAAPSLSPPAFADPGEAGRAAAPPTAASAALSIGTAPGQSSPSQDPALAAAAAGAQPAGPTQSPPSAQARAGAADGVSAATWRTGTVSALWSIDETRNGWINLSGVGWRKVYNGRDFAYLQLITLAAQARQTGATVSYREEADGMIYEIYLW